MVDLEDMEENEKNKICNVYGQVIHQKNQDLWKSLDDLKETGLHLRCIVAGDLNATISTS